jgi:acyl-CoA-binding protein
MVSGGSSVGSARSAHSASTSGTGLTAAFREKVKFMQGWKPGSVPSNRDKLELYAYHKVAVSGDAPSSISSSANAAERAKYQAWRSKSGKSQEESMQLYLQEADRQMRIYGSAVAPIPHNRNMSTPTRTPQTTPAGDNSSNALPSSPTPRGLAAIPLLCAAAAESREAYLRRLAQTSLETAWWVRQEPLCAPPGSFSSFPESLLLSSARFLEHITLTTPGRNMVASFCWPLHKSFLVLWMLIILYVTVLRSAFNTLAILVWGSRRTGLNLNREWIEIIPLVAHSVSVMCEPHQPLTSRLVGLLLLPFSSLIGFLNRTLTDSSVTLASFSMIAVLCATWWYWLFTVPFLMGSLLCVAFGVGFCFVLIELAGV